MKRIEFYKERENVPSEKEIVKHVTLLFRMIFFCRSISKENIKLRKEMKDRGNFKK